MESTESVEARAGRRPPRGGGRVPGAVGSLAWVGAGLGAYLVFRALALAPWVTERAYASWVGPTLGRGVAALTGWVPVPVAPVVLGVVLVGAGWILAREVRRARREGRHRGWGVLAGMLRLAGGAGAAAALFYLVWGFNYARPPLEARLGWGPVAVEAEEGEGGLPADAGPAAGRREVDEVRALAEAAVEAVNAAYLETWGVEDAGRPTAPLPRPERDAALRVGWARVAEALGEGASPPWPDGTAKTVGPAGVLATLGIYGLYFPFTAEPLVNAGLPGVVEPTSAAHEQAHQRGIAPEDEATFLAFLVTVSSPHPRVRYAGWFYAHRRLLADLYAMDPGGARSVAARRLPGVERDLLDLAEYLRRLQGPVNRVADRVNDAYLRSNRVPGGIRSYGMATRLLVGWARENGGRLVPVSATGGP